MWDETRVQQQGLKYLLGRRQVGTVFQSLVTYEQPPTYFATNKVTSCFQEVGAHTPLWC